MEKGRNQFCDCFFRRHGFEPTDQFSQLAMEEQPVFFHINFHGLPGPPTPYIMVIDEVFFLFLRWKDQFMQRRHGLGGKDSEIDPNL
jgi:hypothetical protein